MLCTNIARKLDGNLAGSRSVSAKRAAERIENCAFGDPYDVFREVLVLQTVRITRQRLG